MGEASNETVMNRYGRFTKLLFDRILVAAVVVLLPLTAGNGARPSVPPPPRYTPAHVDAHVVAVWNAGAGPSVHTCPGGRCQGLNAGPGVHLNAPTGDTTLLSKTADTALVGPDGTLHYSISVTNATNVTQTFRLTDTLPASVSYVTGTATGGFVYDAATASLTATTQPLNAFHGDVITTTVGPAYTELLGSGKEQNICQAFFPVCDDDAINIAGVPFRYLGVDYSSITLDSNGFVVPGSVNPNPGDQNQNLPDPTVPNNVIAPFWTELVLKGSTISDTATGDWLFGFLPYNSAEYLVVEWHNAQKETAPLTAYSFQVWIQLGAEHITFAYEGLSGITSPATIGFENSNGTLGYSYLYNGSRMVPAPGSELQLKAVFYTAPLGFDVQARHDLRGCGFTNVVKLSNEAGDLTAAASAFTSAFGPCLDLPSVSR